MARQSNQKARKKLRASDWLIVAAGIGGLAAAAAMAWAYYTERQASGGSDNGAHLVVRLPELSAAATRGKAGFSENCLECHGRRAAGSKRGPPLIHRYYEPSHHGRAAFYRAVKQGVRSHHWDYGNMPPVSGLSDRTVGDIVEYVRELQRANGIR